MKTRKGPKKLKRCFCDKLEHPEDQPYEFCKHCEFLFTIYDKARLKRFFKFLTSKGLLETYLENRQGRA